MNEIKLSRRQRLLDAWNGFVTFFAGVGFSFITLYVIIQASGTVLCR